MPQDYTASAGVTKLPSTNVVQSNIFCCHRWKYYHEKSFISTLLRLKSNFLFLCNALFLYQKFRIFMSDLIKQP